MERGKNITVDMIEKIADAFEINPAYLVDEEFAKQQLFDIAKKHGIEISDADFQMVEDPETGITHFAIKLPPTREDDLLYAFSLLNKAGQEKAVERVEELTEIPKYQKTPSPDGSENG